MCCLCDDAKRVVEKQMYIVINLKETHVFNIFFDRIFRTNWVRRGHNYEITTHTGHRGPSNEIQ
jgi:hypothetical protein